MEVMSMRSLIENALQRYEHKLYQTRQSVTVDQYRPELGAVDDGTGGCILFPVANAEVESHDGITVTEIRGEEWIASNALVDVREVR